MLASFVAGFVGAFACHVVASWFARKVSGVVIVVTRGDE